MSFLLICFLLSTFLGLIPASLLLSKDRLPLASGPYCIIFSLLVLFYKDVPTSQQFQVLSLTLSDKVLTYLAAASIGLSSGTISGRETRSLGAAVSGTPPHSLPPCFSVAGSQSRNEVNFAVAIWDSCWDSMCVFFSRRTRYARCYHQTNFEPPWRPLGQRQWNESHQKS